MPGRIRLFSYKRTQIKTKVYKTIEERRLLILKWLDAYRPGSYFQIMPYASTANERVAKPKKKFTKTGLTTKHFNKQHLKIYDTWDNR